MAAFKNAGVIFVAVAGSCHKLRGNVRISVFTLILNESNNAPANAGHFTEGRSMVKDGLLYKVIVCW